MIDLTGSLLLVMIFINHVPDNPLVVLTSANYGFSDAAEGFVLMAGIAAGLVFWRNAKAEGIPGTLARAWKRAFELHSAHLLIILLAAAFVAWVAAREADPLLLGWVRLGPLFDDTATALIATVLLGHKPNYLDIPPFHITPLLLVPVILLLAGRALMLVRWRTGEMTEPVRKNKKWALLTFSKNHARINDNEMALEQGLMGLLIF